MKVLFLTQVLPYPPDSGPKVKTWNVIKSLAKDYDINLVSFVRGDQSADVAHLESICQAVHTIEIKRGMIRDLWALTVSFLTHEPFLMVRDRRASMFQIVDQLCQETAFEIVHADQLNMAQYALNVIGAQRVLDAHNALWLLYKRLCETMNPGLKKWILNRDWRLLSRYEGDICRTFDAVLAVSEEDRSALEEVAGVQLPIKVIPISIDLNENSTIKRRGSTERILHIGTMYWPANIDGVHWFLDEIWPLVRSRRNGVTFDIIGASPPKDLWQLNQDNSGVNVHGYVVDPTPFLEQAAMLVVPLRAGSGMRVKILNALAQGIPVVTSSVGCEGIQVISGRHLLIADDPETFANAVIAILEDNTLRDRLVSEGQELIRAKYDTRIVSTELCAVYYELINPEKNLNGS